MHSFHQSSHIQTQYYILSNEIYRYLQITKIINNKPFAKKPTQKISQKPSNIFPSTQTHTNYTKNTKIKILEFRNPNCKIKLINKQKLKQKTYQLKALQMYRVLMRIDKIGLRIKEDAQIQVGIRKDQSSIVIGKTGRIVNCVAELDAQTQFFLSANNPTFELIAMLIYNNHKKLVGTLKIDLSKYQLNSNNIIQYNLSHSPDSQSTILLQFTYMTTNYINNQKSLISINQLQYHKIKELTNQMQERNENLVEQNNKLNQQLELLKKDNQNLVNNRNSMEDNYEKCIKGYQEKLDNKNLKIMDSDTYMEEMEVKMKKLRELVNCYGNEDIRQRVEQIFKP